MNKRFFLSGLMLVAALCMIAQNSTVVQINPRRTLSNYYIASQLNGKSGQTLELALKAIVYPHTQRSYSQLWTDFKTTDPGPTDSIPAGKTKTDLVYDMYAWMSQFTKFYSDNDHTQTGGFNREHAVANSWWGGESGNGIAYTDLHHLTPSDGAANNAKSNYPLGEYASGMTLNFPTSTKTNSSGYTYVTADTHSHTAGQVCYGSASHVWKVSNSSNYGGAGYVYEPTDEYKGDFARMYLYVVCAYEEELTWSVNYMFTSDSNRRTTIKPWALQLLLKWHRQDPVSEKELKRNNAIDGIQGNRNPFIDYPDLVEYIWGNMSTTNLQLSSLTDAYTTHNNGGSTTTPTLQSIAISGSLTTTAYNTGDTPSYAGLIATGTYSDGTTADLTQTATWTVSPSTLTASTTRITVTAAVGTISAQQSYNVTVTTPVVQQTATLELGFNLTVGQSAPGLTMNTESDGTITYASSNTAVATVDQQTGAITAVGAGQAVITATVAETDTYESTSIQYVINVSNE